MINDLRVRQVLGDDVRRLVAEVSVEGPSVDHHDSLQLVG